MAAENRVVEARDGTRVFARSDGPADSPKTLIFSQAAGVDLTVWDQVIRRMPDDIRFIRYDLRGHGQSDVPRDAYSMGTLVSDAEVVCTAFDVKDGVFIGHSVGGMIAQGLAVKRLDLIRGLVLTNTAAKIGNKTLWAREIEALEAIGQTTFSEALADKWLGNKPNPVRQYLVQQFLATSPVGYAGVCSAIGGTDFYTPTSGLRLPTLGIAGTRDGISPADLVRETIGLIPGSQFHLMRNTGHFPFVEEPDIFANQVTKFLRQIGHI